VDAIAPNPHRRHEIDQETCIRCGACRTTCPVDAVVVLSGEDELEDKKFDTEIMRPQR
jgi:formate hydrogenlyase subunit 6/NADH:ubiquinone oxidoreductase subunit I